MLSVYVNLFAAVSYVSFLCSFQCDWHVSRSDIVSRNVSQLARVASHANGNVGNVAQVHYYKYFDYVFTCPLLV